MNSLELKDKKAKEHLKRENLEHLIEDLNIQRCIIESSITAIAVADLKGYLTTVNPSFLKMWGYNQIDEVVGKKAISFWKNEDDAIEVINSLKEKKQWEGELKAKKRDGSFFDAHLSANLVSDDHENMKCMVASFIDITDRKKSEYLLRQSEEKFRSLIEKTSDYFWEVDKNGVYVFVSPQVKEILGYEPQELIGKSPSDLRRLDEKEKAPDFFHDIIKSGMSFKTVENKIQNKDGNLLIMETSGIPVSDENGNLLGYYGIDCDITKRKQMENRLLETKEHLKSIISSMDDLVFILDKKGNFLSFYQPSKVSELYMPPEFFSGKSFKKVLPANIAKKLESAIRAVKKTGKAHQFEYSMNISDQELWFEAKVSMRKNMLNDFDGVTGVVRDITERKHFEKAIKISHEQLHNLSMRLQTSREEERAAIARNIHDDLGQTLTYLKMELSSISKQILEANSANHRIEVVKKIESFGELTGRTIKSIRNIVELLKPEIFDHFGLLEAMEQQIQDFRDRTRIRCEYQSNINDISLNKNRSLAIFRILQESLTNVVRHSNANCVKIKFKKNSKEILLTISDNGKGITNEQLTDPKSLGITGMRERAFYLGGSLEIEGRSEKGTIITLKLPLESVE